MLRLNVIEKKENEPIDVIENPTNNVLELADFYLEKLMKASEKNVDVLNFENITFSEKTSDNFQNIYILERCIMDYLRNHKFPKKVQIICEDKKIAELYKVVYNFYYPGSKAERLDDENWD